MESWAIHILYVAIVAIIVAILLVIAYFKKKTYLEEARGNVLAVVKRPTGWPLKKIVAPTPDGWVRVAKGDYKLATQLKEKKPEDITDEERCRVSGEYKFSPWAFEWDVYPSTPFLGLKVLRVPIRRCEWWENDPNPIIKPEFLPAWKCSCGKEYHSVTAADAQAHTREMDAMNVAIRIQEAEARQNEMQKALANLPNKVVLYGLLFAAVLFNVISLIRGMTPPGG